MHTIDMHSARPAADTATNVSTTTRTQRQLSQQKVYQQSEEDTKDILVLCHFSSTYFYYTGWANNGLFL